MIKRSYDENTFVANMHNYAGWKARAERATLEACSLVERGLAPALVPDIWGSVKPALLKHFIKKCAYCETPITRFWGDVEHYRPKGKVTEDGLHPGYYWLAYDTQNLLPSCQFCNQGHGKMNQFPVAGTYWRKHSEPCAEEPLLVNPYFDDPSEYFIFPFDKERLTPLGTIEARDRNPRGLRSIDIYNLNDASLVDQRKGSQQNAINSFITEDNARRGQAYIDSIEFDDQPYAAARLAAVFAWIDCDNERRALLKKARLQQC